MGVSWKRLGHKDLGAARLWAGMWTTTVVNTWREFLSCAASDNWSIVVCSRALEMTKSDTIRCPHEWSSLCVCVTVYNGRTLSGCTLTNRVTVNWRMPARTVVLATSRCGCVRDDEDVYNKRLRAWSRRVQRARACVSYACRRQTDVTTRGNRGRGGVLGERRRPTQATNRIGRRRLSLWQYVFIVSLWSAIRRSTSCEYMIRSYLYYDAWTNV